MSDSKSNSTNVTTYINVSKRFDDILKIYFTISIINFVRDLIMLLGVATKIPHFGYAYYILAITDLISIAAAVILHWTRFLYSGRYCSGDYVENENIYFDDN
jgi:hypothetical protein